MSTGEIMKVNSIFPSKKVNDETRGGLILLKLKKISDEGDLKLIVSYEDRDGVKESEEASIVMNDLDPDYFDNSGIRKGILLVRYADLIKKWLAYERDLSPSPYLSRWERQSLTLSVSGEFKDIFELFSKYFEKEMNEIEDESLSQELEILLNLSKFENNIVLLTEEDNYRLISIHKGDGINLTLKDYGDSGYEWVITEINSSLLSLENSISWGSIGLLGDFGNNTWLFEAIGSGNTTLTLKCFRPWENEENATKTFSVKLDII